MRCAGVSGGSIKIGNYAGIIRSSLRRGRAGANPIGLGFGWKIHPLMPPNCRLVANLARVTTHQVTGRQQATTSPKTPAATSQPSDGQWDCNFISGCRSVLGDADM